MTSLDCKVVRKGRDYTVTKHVCGDLSFSYQIRPNKFINYNMKGQVDSVTGFGIAVNKLSDAKMVIALCGKHGYKKAQEIWWKKTGVGSGYSFGFLKGKEAKNYSLFDDAYGDYALKLKKSQKNKKTKRRRGCTTFL